MRSSVNIKMLMRAWILSLTWRTTCNALPSNVRLYRLTLSMSPSASQEHTLKCAHNELTCLKITLTIIQYSISPISFKFRNQVNMYLSTCLVLVRIKNLTVDLNISAKKIYKKCLQNYWWCPATAEDCCFPTQLGYFALWIKHGVRIGHNNYM